MENGLVGLGCRAAGGLPESPPAAPGKLSGTALLEGDAVGISCAALTDGAIKALVKAVGVTTPTSDM